MKSMIIYKGKYGATKQYAEWIADALGQPCFYAGDESSKDLEAIDWVIIGTSIYISKLQINKWVKKNLATLKDKKIFLYLVAGTPSHEKTKLDGY
ncbi:MAG TPA: flavodoxin domain-containing protein, partial [Chitinophagaceae bacterium]